MSQSGIDNLLKITSFFQLSSLLKLRIHLPQKRCARTGQDEGAFVCAIKLKFQVHEARFCWYCASANTCIWSDSNTFLTLTPAFISDTPCHHILCKTT